MNDLHENISISSLLPKYKKSEERQKTFEDFIIKLMKLRNPEGKAISLPYLMDLMNIYAQAEDELWKVTHQQS